MLRLILEAALRSLLMAVAVWGGIRLFRVQAVFAQKVAWVLVLIAAAAMPLAMRLPWLTQDWALKIPVRTLHPALSESADKEFPLSQLRISPRRESGVAHSPGIAQKPSPAHLPPYVFPRAPKVQQARSEQLSQNETSPSAPSASIATNVQPISIAGKFKRALGTWSQIRFALLTLYGAAAGILLVRTLAGLGIAARIWLRSKPLDSVLVGNVSPVRVSPDLSTPVTIGSTIILPADFQTWDEAKLRIVLAHEQSHVHQGDFYLQLAAAVHVAVFWFSPLGWWLQRKLSELGEALSDRAGLEQAANPASYAQVLLEFAAQPRRTRIPLAGVAMARSSSVSSRIERILNARLFQIAFLGGRRHAFLAAVLVPVMLVAVIVGIRIVPQIAPQVKAARAQTASSGSAQGAGQTSSPAMAQSSGQAAGQGTSGSADSTTGQVTGQVSGATPGQVISVDAEDAEAQQAPPAVPPIAAPAPPAVPGVSADMQRDRAMEALDMAVAEAHKGYAYTSDDDADAFAIVHENSDKTIRMNGTYNDDFAKLRKNLHGNYIWFERDGKSYVITDPAVIAKCEALFKSNQALDIRMKTLNEVQAKLNLEMAKLEPIKMDIQLDSPEFKIEMDKLQVELKELQNIKIKEITDKVNVEVLEDLQSKMGDIQGQIGEIQGKIGEKQGLLGEKQGEIGERMGKLGEEMGKIGEQQGKIAEEASRKIKPLLDQAIKDGKAKPAN